jgi:hypothetical protein
MQARSDPLVGVQRAFLGRLFLRPTVKGHGAVGAGVEQVQGGDTSIPFKYLEMFGEAALAEHFQVFFPLFCRR